MMRYKRTLIYFFLLTTLVSFSSLLTFALDESPSVVSEPTSTNLESAAPQAKQAPKLVSPPKGRIVREKEAEGTQAPNRFGSDIIIKSKYEFNGQSLEVDTD